MARQTIQTLLSIGEWSQLLGISPWEFNQFNNGFPSGVVSPCESVWYQYSYQKDFISREEIAQSISDAERMIADQLGWWPAPKFTVADEGRYPYNTNGWYASVGYSNRGMWKEFTLDWDKFISGGVFARETISDAAVTYSDEDGDGIEETATVTFLANAFTVMVTDIAEIALYNVLGDRMGQALSEDFRIRPLNVSIAAGTVTVTFHKAQGVQPALHEDYNPDELDITTAANFIEEVTPARVYIDTTYTSASPNQGQAIWNPPPGCATDNCVESSIPVCLIPAYPQKGLIRAQLNATSDSWPYGWEPDRMSLNYVSGEKLQNGRMRRDLALMVARLATALLPRDKCGCERAQRILHHWRALVSEPGEFAGEGRGITVREIESNPFGETRLGALYAWKRCQAMQGVRAVSVL